MLTLPRTVRQAPAVLMRGLKYVLAVALPPTCIACRATLPAQEPMGFCPACYATLPWWNTAHLLPPQLPPAVTSFRAPCLYAGPLRQAIITFKFHDAPHLAGPLAKLLRPFVPAALSNPLLVPVPSHGSRLRRRTYNHAAILTQNLAALTSIPANATTLRRLTPSNPQASKTRAARLSLPGTAFSANPKHIKDKDIILIDDIYTTGATARACAIALKRAGAASVHVVTLAYTAPE